MAFLPPGLAQRASEAEVTIRGENLRDGEYTLMHLLTTYESKLKKGPALIIRHRIMEAKAIKEGVEPNPVGTDVSYFMPDYGDAKVMLEPNYKGYALGLLGLDQNKVDKKKLAETLDLIGGERQLARGMLIRGVTFHTTKKDGGDFIGINWHPVAGENVPDASSVKKRRAEIEASKASNWKPEEEEHSTNGASAPDVPGEEAAPDVPGADPMEGWKQHPKNATYFFRPDKTKKKAYTKEQILAGQATE